MWRPINLWGPHANKVPLPLLTREIKPHVDPEDSSNTVLPQIISSSSLLHLIAVASAEVYQDSKQRPPLLHQCTCHDSSMSNTAEDLRLAAPNPVDPIASPTGNVRHGHESLIAQPSTFLLPRGHNRAMAEKEKPLTALDNDQQQGLVSGASSSYVTV